MTSLSSSSASRTGTTSAGIRHWGFRALIAAVLILGTLAVLLFFMVWQQNDSESPPHTLVSDNVGRDRNESAWLFSPDNKYLISTWNSIDREYGLSVWDVVKKEKLHSIKMPRQVRAVSISARGDLLAVAFGEPLDVPAKRRKDDGKPREVRLYSFPEMKEVGRIESEHFIDSAILSPDGKFLATAHMPDDVKRWDVVLWETVTRKPKHVLTQGVVRDFTDSADRIRFTPDGKTVAHITRQAITGKPITRMDYNIIVTYETDSGKKLASSSIGEVPPIGFEYLPDGKQMLVCWPRKVVVSELATGKQKLIHEIEGPRGGRIRHAAVSADGELLALAIDDRDVLRGPRVPLTILVRDLTADKLRHKLKAPGTSTGIYSLAISPDKKAIAYSTGGLHLFDISGK